VGYKGDRLARFRRFLTMFSKTHFFPVNGQINGQKTVKNGGDVLSSCLAAP
jgi:hypothetical protein